MISVVASGDLEPRRGRNAENVVYKRAPGVSSRYVMKSHDNQLKIQLIVKNTSFNWYGPGSSTNQPTRNLCCLR